MISYAFVYYGIKYMILRKGFEEDGVFAVFVALI